MDVGTETGAAVRVERDISVDNQYVELVGAGPGEQRSQWRELTFIEVPRPVLGDLSHLDGAFLDDVAVDRRRAHYECGAGAAFGRVVDVDGTEAGHAVVPHSSASRAYSMPSSQPRSRWKDSLTL
ncbi:hypothetical protein EDD34_0050 [Myceligenerans xiligouense]|uniref:Uncharacterized protein n=1 Tax=Myceligenerans xiligouense TaxID=253184 RepID=A0A3N4ZHX4_9MICO|nr:hypothetical protein EDD34_0050 [Myceligenerans xiligouense]